MTAPQGGPADLAVRDTFPGAVSHRGLTFATVRGFRPLLMDVHVPVGVPAPVPCVVWVHGGGWEAGDRRHPPADWPADLLFGSFLAEGLAVATVDYRLSAEAHHPAQLHDVKAAVRFVRRHAVALGVDPDRLGVAGESAGGHLAAMIALTAGRPALDGDVGREAVDPATPTAVRAAAVLYGVTDFAAQLASGHLAPEDVLDAPEVRLLGATPEQAPALAAAASPVTYASASAPPVLLISGDADHCFDGVDPAGPLAVVTRFLADRLGAARPAAPAGGPAPAGPAPGPDGGDAVT